MARCHQIADRLAIEPSRGFTHQPSDRRTSVRREPIPAVGRAVVLAFLGIGDIEIIRAEGLALSPAHREAALNAAHTTIPTTVAAARPRQAA